MSDHRLTKIKNYLENNWLRIPSKEEIQNNQEKVKSEKEFVLVSYGRKGHFGNWVLKSDFEQNKFEKILHQVNAFFHSLDTQYNWLVKEEHFNNWLENKLIENNFRLLEEIDCMLFDLSKYEGNNINTHKIKKVTNREDLIKALRIDDSYEDFSEEAFLNSIEKNVNILDDDNYLWLLAEVDNNAVGMTSLTFLENKNLAYFSGATTLEEYRNKGIYASLTNYRLEYAQKMGSEFAITHAVSDTSGPLLKKMGFRTVAKLRVYGSNDEYMEKL